MRHHYARDFYMIEIPCFTYMCTQVTLWTIIRISNSLRPGLNQWRLLWIRPLETHYNDILFVIQKFSFKGRHLKVSSETWPPFCLGPNGLARRGVVISMTELVLSKIRKKNALGSIAPVPLRISPNSWVSHRTTHANSEKLCCPNHFLVARIVLTYFLEKKLFFFLIVNTKRACFRWIMFPLIESWAIWGTCPT